MTRVPSYVSSQVLLNRMVDLQGMLYDSTLQVNSKKKSQTYAGLSIESFRLVNMETIRDRAERFKAGNVVAEVRANQTQNCANDIERNAQKVIADIREVAKLRTDRPASEYIASLNQMRKNAVGSLAQIRDTLNTDLEGRYLFSGGREQTPPVKMPVSSLEAFEAVYNGNTVTFPETRAANLFDIDFRAVDVVFNNPAAISGTSYGTIAADTGAGETKRFITGSISAATAGTMTFATSVPDPRPAPAPAEGSITSPNANAFSRLERGMALLIDSGTAANDGVYTITEISEDGRYMKVTPPFPSAATESINLNVGVPNGAAIRLENSTGNNTIFTVRYPSNTDITGAGTMTQILAGEMIYTTPVIPTIGNQTDVNIVSTGYYQGDNLRSEHRVDENRIITIGVNAQDAAFEKLIRGLGIIGQGFPVTGTGDIDLPEFYRRLETGIALINDAILHDEGMNESRNDLSALQQTIGFNRVELKGAEDRARNFIAFLETGIADIEEVDMAEAITRLNETQRALEASYQVTGRLAKLSLKDYI
ncbi:MULTISPECIES: flagellin [unclassified Haematospirillum]|uniref:flagellin n=1 Tax=unclassified Haematospirillum TaxID=2622088 RepID=UPI0014395ED1|nr:MULTISPECIES: flagellin [unclassified Haematospirillum]NKD55812.1 hypothetical protein [Haematospirillum sp. H4890]NKD75877.1 hypothetical protein [Haematospirillum sp. H4485]NKD87945.1 hypothetical protein [Haematospirillum sp. 15-248]